MDKSQRKQSGRALLVVSAVIFWLTNSHLPAPGLGHWLALGGGALTLISGLALLFW